MPRAIWKGVIHLGELTVPVKLYSAVQDRDVHFHLLHDRDRVRVRQRMVHPGTGEAVTREQSLRAYEVEPGVFVRVEPEDLAALEPQPSRQIAVTRCVEPGAIAHVWFDRPYYLGPDGDAGRYAALARALEDAERVAVARWVMRKRSYAGVLHARAGLLRLFTLHAREDVVDLAQLEGPGGRALEPRERALAEQLVSALAGDFDPAAYRDEHRARVLTLIAQKRQGRTIEKARVERRPAPPSLAGALQKSLSQARKERKSA
jgi:DNA end-binding protein Ku